MSISAGPGYYFLTNPQQQTDNFFATSNPPGLFNLWTQETQELKSQFGGIFGGGLDYKISETSSIGIDVAYIYWRPMLHDSTTSTLSLESGSVTTATSSDTRLNLDTEPLSRERVEVVLSC